MEKVTTGIKGLDNILHGGLPKSEATYVIGNAGSGKTMLALQFLYAGASQNENGLMVSFEETQKDLLDDYANMDMDLASMVDSGLLTIDYVFFEENTYTESEHFSLDGLLIRLDYLLNKTGAKRIVLDSFKALFERFGGPVNFRMELSSLIKWLKEKGVTTVITGGESEGTLGVEAYVADCVILLDQRVMGQLSTRRMRVHKYRGTSHETDEFPFILSKAGFVVTPINTSNLDHKALDTRISTGIESLDTMFGGKGFFKGSSILVSGQAGCGKSSMAASFIHEVCSNGQKAMMFQFEESRQQIIRNMSSIGLDLEPFIDQGLLEIHSVRPTNFGLEGHLLNMIHAVDRFEPTAVTLDPITSFWNKDEDYGIKSLMTRIIDHLKSKQITGMFLHLMHGENTFEAEDTLISSLIDTWVALRNRETDASRYRELYIVKSRGMAHDHSIHTFKITDNGFAIDRKDYE